MPNRRLKAEMARHGFTNRSLGDCVGVPEFEVTRWRTDRKTPPPALKEKVAMLLFCRAWEVFDS